MPEPASPIRRFYRAAAFEPAPDGFVLTLDGRPARTPGRAPLVLPKAALAEAVAREWHSQEGAIVPASMPITRLANSAIDGVAREVAAVRAEIARYAGSDLVVYRAGDPAGLVAAQSEAWDPVLAWADSRLGARFVRREGLMFVEQPPASLSRVRERLERISSPFALAALHVMTTLTGSALIALMVAAGALGPDEAWQAAHVDELFQESRWGADEEATARRTARERDFRAAATVLALGGGV